MTTVTSQRVLRNATILFISQVLTKLIAFANFLILTRLLGDRGFGEMSFGLSYAVLFIVISNLGVDTIVIRDIAQKQQDPELLVGNSAALRFVLTLLTLAMAIGSSFVFGYSGYLRLVIFLYALVVMEDAYARLLLNVFRAYQRMEYEAIVLLVEKILIFGGLAVGFLLRINVYQVALIYIGAGVIKLILTVLLMERRFLHLSLQWDVKFWRSILHESIPFAGIIMLGTISWKIDTVMLQAMKGETVVGWYAAPYRIIETLLFVPDAVGSALMPAVASLFVSARWKVASGVRQGIRLLAFVGIGLAIGGTTLSRELLGLVLGPHFAPSIPAFQILVWAMAFIFIEYVTSNTLTATHLQMKMILISAIGVVVNVSLNLFLIPKYSLIGASIATVVTEACNATLGLYFIWRLLRESILSVDIFKYILAGITMGLVIIGLKSFSWITAGLVGSVIYVVVAFLLKGIRQVDVALVREFIARRGRVE
ncbi:MAG: flippase [Bacteroidota bacterium]